MEEIPDVGPYLWIPSYGTEASEMEHMRAEYEWEQQNPTDDDLEYAALRQETKAAKHRWYREACDQRKAEAQGNQRQFGVN